MLEDTPADSVDRDAPAWLRELPGVDSEVETARMRLLRIGRQLDRMLTQIAGRHGMTLGDWETLSWLSRAGPPYQATPTALATALGVTAGTMTVRLDRLREAGLVATVAATGDRRQRSVRLTAAGRRRWRAATDERLEMEGRLLADIDLPGLNLLLRQVMLRLEVAFGAAPPRQLEA
jgi:DNA-binding MarR family transcriptional regulator